MNSNVGQGTSGVNAHPCLRRGEVWSASGLMITLGIHRRTLSRWEAAGLPRLQPGTKEVFYLADDVIEIMRKPVEEIPEYVPKYKQRE